MAVPLPTDVGDSVQISARLSPRAIGILRDKRKVLNVASDAEVLEISLGLLEVCGLDAKVERARTQLWKALQREAATASLSAIQGYMAQFKRKRGRRPESRTPELK